MDLLHTLYPKRSPFELPLGPVGPDGRQREVGGFASVEEWEAELRSRAGSRAGKWLMLFALVFTAGGRGEGLELPSPSPSPIPVPIPVLIHTTTHFDSYTPPAPHCSSSSSTVVKRLLFFFPSCARGGCPLARGGDAAARGRRRRGLRATLQTTQAGEAAEASAAHQHLTHWIGGDDV